MGNLRETKDNIYLIMLSPDQFGYHTDDYYRAYYAREEFKVYVICYDHKKEKINLDGVSVTYVKYGRGRIKDEIAVLYKLNEFLLTINQGIIYTRFFAFCVFFRLLNIRRNFNWILDIRTGSVSSNCFLRLIYNSCLRFTALAFNEVTIISSSLAKILKLNRYSIVPLGGQPLVNFDELKPNLNVMNFIYVGIFDGRNIKDTINAYARFYNQYGNNIRTKYTIIGYAIDKEEEKSIINAISENMNAPIYYVGRVPNMKLKAYFNEANIGISYIPITPWYDVQPPTKTYEYLVNGLFCIATDTSENRHIITPENGILIKDNKKSVFEAMVQLYDMRYSFDRHEIAKKSDHLTWSTIYAERLRPVLKCKGY